MTARRRPEDIPRDGSIVRFRSEPDGPTYYVKAGWFRHRPTRWIVAITPTRESAGDPRLRRPGTYLGGAFDVVRHTKPLGDYTRRDLARWGH